MLMAKKNPYKFSIGFSSKNPAHRKVASILNEMETGLADFIATAILQYLGDSDSKAVPGVNMESLQPLISAMVRKEVEKALSEQAPVPVETGREVLDLSEDVTVSLDENVKQGITNAMEAFRRL